MKYYWCTEHHRVETDMDMCPKHLVLGPYASNADAVSAINRIKEREARLSAEDAAWSGDD